MASLGAENNHSPALAAWVGDVDNAVVQHLFHAGLALQEALNGDPRSRTAEGIHVALSEMDQAIKDIRQDVFSGRPIADAP